jgi:hypothetical protein
MPDSWDDSFDRAGTDPLVPAPRQRPTALWVAAGLLIVVAGVGAYLLLRGTPQVAGTTAAKGAPAEPKASAGGVGEVAPVDLPPLDQSDAMVRELLRKLSSHPEISAWLATEGLIRNFTVVVTNIADGKAPSRFLRPLKPTGSFAVITPAGHTEIDPRSYDRYTRVAEAAASIDTAGAARLYTLLKPRIEEASAELGNAGSFDRTLERAIAVLLDTPLPEGPVLVKEIGATGYRFADDSLEALTGAQKQLLRMGPRNQRAIQAALRAVAQALGFSVSSGRP